ncbi:MAG: murein biosynthesis integral membrane protein MurJ, partial [Planctomycetales bacterium]|nr:murein biosynthesis integral membrane protein MurJ [Planctomycetales bacterium]
MSRVTSERRGTGGAQAPPSVVSAARFVAICTLASRVTGLARDMLMTQVFAITWVYDAFNYAFLIPNLFRRLFGEGALSAAFVPTFTHALEREGRESAWRMLARTLALLTVALSVVVILIEAIVLAGALTATAENTARTLKLTAIMTPFMLTICVVALFSSILNCLGSFVPAALTPLLLNIGMIVGVLWSGQINADDPQRRVVIVAISVIVAGVIQILVLIPALRRRGAPLGWRWEPGDPQVRRMLALMAPIAVGQGVLLLSTFLDAQLCLLLTRAAEGSAQASFLGVAFQYPLEPGALSALSVAQRLYQFPLGVLGISLAVSVLPALTRQVAREDWQSWREQSRASFRMAVFLGLLSGALMVALSEPIVRMLFEYRRFAASDTARVAPVLAWYGVGMWAFCSNHIVLRMFYSLGDVRTPLRISCALVPFNLALSVGL